MIIESPTEKNNICGTRIKELRMKMNLSQEQLAARLQTEGLGVNQNSVSRIETGKRIVADFELKAIAKVLHTDVDTLLEDNQTEN